MAVKLGRFRLSKGQTWYIYMKDTSDQGYKARKVISEAYACFVLQCTVSGR